MSRRFFLAADDPALQWLGQPARWLLSSTVRVAPWALLLLPLAVLLARQCRWQPTSSGPFVLFMAVYVLAVLGALMSPAMPAGPGMIQRTLARRIIVRRARAAAAAVDAAGLATLPDGAIVIATGRVRGRERLAQRVGG